MEQNLEAAITQTEVEQSPRSGAGAPSAPSKPRRFAVVVGINDYSNTTASDLRFCANDAEAIYESLLNYGKYSPEDTALFSDGTHAQARQPSYSDVLAQVQEFAAQCQEQDTFLFFFAGHGTSDQDDSYLLTNEFRPNILADSSIALAKIDSYMRGCKAKFVLRIVDACHSGRMGRRFGGSDAELANPNIEELLNPKIIGWATLASCKTNEYAHELDDINHGIFSFFLIKGLSGEAATSDGRVTLDSLKLYVLDNVIELTKKRGLVQTPVFSGEHAGQCVLALPPVAEVPDANGATTQVLAVPQVLQQIVDFPVEQLTPESEGVLSLLDELKAALVAPTPAARFVATNKQHKKEHVGSLTSELLIWAQQQVQKANASFGEDLFSVQEVRVEIAPLQKELAKTLYELPTRDIIEWRIETHIETKYRRERVTPTGIVALMRIGTTNQDVQYEEVPYEKLVFDGVQQKLQNNSTVVLSFSPRDHLTPRCALVAPIIPTSIGSYTCAYFASTRLEDDMEEEWDGASYSRRFLVLNPIVENAFDLVKPRLEENFAQFLSFILESRNARHALFERMGIPKTGKKDSD